MVGLQLVYWLLHCIIYPRTRSIALSSFCLSVRLYACLSVWARVCRYVLFNNLATGWETVPSSQHHRHHNAVIFTIILYLQSINHLKPTTLPLHYHHNPRQIHLHHPSTMAICSTWSLKEDAVRGTTGFLVKLFPSVPLFCLELCSYVLAYVCVCVCLNVCLLGLNR